MAGTSNGQLLMFSKAELKAIYNVETLLKFDPRLSVDNPYSVRPLSKNQNINIGCCTPFADGLLFTVGNDQVYYYEVSGPRDSSTGYRLSRRYGDCFFFFFKTFLPAL